MSFFSKKEQKKNKLDDTSMDDDLDFDFSSMDDEFSIDEKSRTPIQRVASGIKSSVKSTASNPGTYKKLMLKALPEEYTQVHDELDNRLNKLTTATSDAVDKLKPELKTLANKVDKLIPENQRILRKIYDKTLGKHKEEEYSSSDRPDVQQEQITNALNEVFNKQNEVSLQMQARKAAEDGIKNKTEHNRFLTNFQVMSNVDSNLSAIRNYQDTVTQAYQKKTLELQYRSYFVQAETLKAIRDHAVASRAENKSIVKNTALPDFAKITAYEKVKDVFSTKFGEKLHQGIFGGSFVENITKSITSKIAEITDSIKMGISSIDMASGMIDDKYEAAGGIAGNAIADKVGDIGSKFIRKNIEKNPETYKKVVTTGKKLVNRFIGNTDGHIKRIADEKLTSNYNADPTIFREVVEGLKSFGKDIINGALTGPDLNMESMKNASKDVNGLFKPSVFTDKAHTSITEVIPGYLSRMLRELTIIRTGDASAPTQMFDYKSNKFSTSTTIAKQYKDKFLESNGKDSVLSKKTDNVTKEIAGDAPENVKKELKQFIGDITTTSNMVYDSKGIRESKAYSELSTKAKQSVDRYLQQVDQDKLLKEEFEGRLNSIKSSYGDPRGDVEEGLKLGHGDILESLGLVTRDKDNLYKLNTETYRNISTKGLKIKTPGKEKVSKPIFNQIQDPVDRQASTQTGSITATVDLSSLIQNDNTNASNLLNKIDELTNVVKNLKISVGGRHKSSYEGLRGDLTGGYASFKEKLTSLKIPDSVKEYYERAVLTGKMTAEKAQEEIDKLSKKVKFGDMTLGQVGRDVLEGAKKAGGFAIDAGTKTAKAAWKSTKWLGGKAADFAKAAKDPVYNAMSKIFTTMVDFSKSAIEVGKDFLFNKLPSGLKSFKGAVSSVAKNVNDYILSQDVYVKGEDKPRLFSRLLRNGFYRLQKDGKVVYTFKDISDTVVDSEGNVVISAEDITKGLVDKDGEPLRTPFEKLTKFAVEGSKKAVLKAIATSKAIVEGTKNAATGVSNFVKRGLGIGGLSGNYGGGSSKDSATMVQVLTQIRDILLFKFKLKESDIGKKPSKDDDTSELQTSPSTEETTTVTSGDSSPRYNAGGSGLLGSIGGMASGAFGKLKGFFGKKKAPGISGSTGPIVAPTVGKKGLLGKLGGFGSRALGAIGGLFGGSSSNEQQAPTETLATNQQPATAVTTTKNVINKEPVDVKQKNSYKARLAKLDEEAKNRHKFKQTEARARYEGGEGILGMFKKAYDFITNIMSVSGLGRLLTGVLSKIPVIGKLFGGAKAAGAAGAAAKGAASTVAGVAKKGLIRTAVVKGAGLLGSGLLSSAATAATTAAAVVGKAAIGIGSALGGLISAPVVLGALAVAAVAYGGYKLYKHMTRNDLTELEQIRYRQYGFDLDSDTHVSKLHIIKSLEKFILESGIVITKENISISSKIDTKTFFGILGIDPEKEKEKAQRAMDWFIVRFKPFFLKHCVAIYKANPKYKLFDLEKLTKDEKMVYLDTISSDLDGPYDYTEAPLQEMGRLAATKDIVKTSIEKAIQDLKSKLKKPSSSKQEAQKLKTDIAAKAAEQAKLAQQEVKTVAEEAKKPIVPPVPQPKTVNQPTEVIKPQQGSNISDLPVASKNGATVPEGDGKEAKAPSTGNSDVNIPISNELRVAGGGLKDGSNAMQYITLNKKNIDIENLDPVVKSVLFGMIQEYGELTGKKVVITDGFRSRAEQERLHKLDPKKAAPPGKSLHEFGIAVDMDRNSYNEMESLGLMRKYGFTRPVGGEPWHAEPAGIQTDINRAKQDPNFRQAAVHAGLFKGGGGYGTDPGANKYRRNNKLAMSLLQDSGKPIDPSSILASAEGNNKASGIAPTGQAPVLAKAEPPAQSNDGMMKTSTTQPSPTTTTAASSSSSATPTSSPLEWNRINTGSNNKVYTDTPSDAPNTMSSGFSNVRAKPEVISAITDAGQKIGVDPSKLMTMAAVESGLKPDAKAKTSSASGLFQFIKSTWQSVAPTVGLPANANPLDPEDNALVGAKYVKDNEIALSKAGVKPGLLETYVAHFLGTGGAKQFLKADDNAIAADIMPKAAKANKNIFYTNGKANTVSEVKQLLAKKLSTRAKEFNIPTDPSLSNVASTATTAKPTDKTTSETTSSVSDTISASTGPSTTGPASTIDTSTTPSISTAPTALYSKPSIPLGDTPSPVVTKQVTSNAGQENYSKLISDSVSTSLGYQKSMVEHLASIDTNLIKALQNIISQAGQGGNTSSTTGSNRSSKENLAPTIDMSRKKAIAT